MRRRFAVLLPLVAMLAACWQSDVPLIADKDAETPDIAGEYKEQGPGFAVTITRAGKDYTYQKREADGSLLRRQLRFDQLQGDYYLVQSRTLADTGGMEAPFYRLVRIRQGTITEYQPACGAPEITFEGVSSSEGDCSFTTYKGLRDAALGRLELAQGGDPLSLTLEATYVK
ncbi:MAG: hypothetical protein EOP02_18195 [Proteobacteria bacterium]|nr:MAG: hypothetical protein EOP02_18195 [Pseudomonadota bacterium]